MLDNSKTINRRQFLQILAMRAGAGSLMAAGFGCSSNGVRRVSETRVLMEPLVNITVVNRDEAAARKAVVTSFERMKELELILSRFDPDSQVAWLNQTGCVVNAHPALVELLQQANTVSELSDGAFDIRVKPLVEIYQRRFKDGG